VVLVRAEHRPTLGEVLARRSPAARRAILVLLALIVAGALALRLAPKQSGVVYIHDAAPVFNLRYGGAFTQLKPQRDELLHIRRKLNGRVVDSFAVRRLVLPPYQGDVNGLLPTYAEKVLAELRAAYPGLVLVEEGKARVGLVPGYSILFRVGSGRDRMYGREVLLPQPVPGTRTGVRMALRTWKGSGISQPRDLGTRGALRSPYRLFRFGTEGA
jgi:hypothetical protein